MKILDKVSNFGQSLSTGANNLNNGTQAAGNAAAGTINTFLKKATDGVGATVRFDSGSVLKIGGILLLIFFVGRKLLKIW